MADALDPYAPPAGGVDPSDPYAMQVPPWYMDIAKTAAPSAIRALTGLLTTAPTMTNLTGLGIEKAADYIPWISPETAEAIKAGGKYAQEKSEPYTYGGVKSKIESVLPAESPLTEGGQLYEAKGTPGKIAQNTIEIAPSLVGGGVTGVIPKLANLKKPVEMGVRALAGGVGATGAEELAQKGVDAGLLPEWSVPVAKAGGAITGVTAGPATVRRAITPLPATAEHAKMVQALRDAGVNNLTPAQTTGRQGLYQFESNLREKPLVARDTAQLTEAAAKQAGMPAGTTRLSPEAFSEADKALQTTKQAVQAAEIKGTDFSDLQKAFKTVGADAKKALHNDPGMVNVENRISQLAGSPGALSMPGPRYQQMRTELQGAISNSKGAERDAYVALKDHLDAAMAKQLPPELAQRHLGAANLGVLAKAPLEQQQVTPNILKNTIIDQWGQEAYNKGRGMAPLSQAAETVMNRPAASKETSKLVEALTTGGGVLSVNPQQGGLHQLFGGFIGKHVAPSVQWALKQGAKPLYFNPVTKGYLGNQLLAPGPATALSPEMFVKALRSPVAAPQLTVQP